MFCQKCGTEVADDINYCPKCGNSISSEEKQVTNMPSISYQESGRGTLILILGIFSFIFGPFLGIPAWIMGNSDLKKIKQGIISIGEKTSTKIGMILGIITTLLIPVVIVFGIALVVGINVFTASSVQANRDALIADCTNIAAMSQQYYRKPSVLGGGGNSFTGFEIPSSIKVTANGEYSIQNLQKQSLSIIGIGNEIGDNGSDPIKIEMKVLPTTIDVNILN